MHSLLAALGVLALFAGSLGAQAEGTPPPRPALQRCSEKSAFAPFGSVLRKSGRVAVRARLWRDSLQRCTASFPAHCVSSLVLSPDSPRSSDERPRQAVIVLEGEWAGAPLSCAATGPEPGQPQEPRSVTCPLPAKGEEVGVVGVLDPPYVAESRTSFLRVESICLTGR
jgi:hypothetical protein